MDKLKKEVSQYFINNSYNYVMQKIRDASDSAQVCRDFWEDAKDGSDENE